MSTLGTQVFANPSTPIWLHSSTVLPPGPTGSTGPTGPQGTQGSTGPQGPMNPLTQYGTVATSGASGNTTVTLTTPYTSATSYVAIAVMEDTNPAQMSVNRLTSNTIQVYWANGGGGSHTVAWVTVGA